MRSGAHAPRNFGIALAALGIGMLVLGIGYHLQFMYALRRMREGMATEGMVHAQSPFPPSLTLIAALILLAIGIVAIANMLL